MSVSNYSPRNELCSYNDTTHTQYSNTMTQEISYKQACSYTVILKMIICDNNEITLWVQCYKHLFIEIKCPKDD